MVKESVNDTKLTSDVQSLKNKLQQLSQLVDNEVIKRGRLEDIVLKTIDQKESKPVLKMLEMN